MKRVRILEGDSPQDATWIKTRVTPQAVRKYPTSSPRLNVPKCVTTQAPFLSLRLRENGLQEPCLQERRGRARQRPARGARGEPGQVKADVLTDPGAAAQPRRLPAAR